MMNSDQTDVLAFAAPRPSLYLDWKCIAPLQSRVSTANLPSITAVTYSFSVTLSFFSQFHLKIPGS